MAMSGAVIVIRNFDDFLGLIPLLCFDAWS
jgi:hypothetical protein